MCTYYFFHVVTAFCQLLNKRICYVVMFILQVDKIAAAAMPPFAVRTVATCYNNGPKRHFKALENKYISFGQKGRNVRCPRSRTALIPVESLAADLLQKEPQTLWTVTSSSECYI